MDLALIERTLHALNAENRELTVHRADVLCGWVPTLLVLPNVTSP